MPVSSRPACARLGFQRLLTAAARLSATPGAKRCFSAQSTGDSVRLRFGPSPTGFLHLGGLRSALFNFLLARKSQGSFLLRIEDTDQSRLVPGAQQALVDTLKAVHVDFDEGPGVGGPHAPYVQSQRLGLYQEHMDQLIEAGKAYRCFCPQDRLENVKAKYRRAHKSQSYDGHCKEFSKEQSQKMARSGKAFVIRFQNAPGLQPSEFQDLVYGTVGSKNVKLIVDDYILVKSDGYPTYHFANVVDDHLMNVTHVMRGEEWLPSTPKHIALYNAFGWTPPQFAHMPILVSPSGKKMSKRDGEVHVEQYLKDGWEPEAIINYVALMSASWDSATAEDGAPITDQVMLMSDLIRNFSLGHLNRHRSAIFGGKLSYLNRKHIERKISTPEGLSAIIRRLQPLLALAYPRAEHQTSDEHFATRLFFLLKDRIDKLNDLPALNELKFILESPDYSTETSEKMRSRLPAEEYMVAVHDSRSALQQLAGSASEVKAEEVQQALDQVKQSTGLEGKHLMTPLRHALTATRNGPDLPSLISLIGVEETLRRLDAALQLQSNS